MPPGRTIPTTQTWGIGDYSVPLLYNKYMNNPPGGAASNAQSPNPVNQNPSHGLLGSANAASNGKWFCALDPSTGMCTTRSSCDFKPEDHAAAVDGYKWLVSKMKTKGFDVCDQFKVSEAGFACFPNPVKPQTYPTTAAEAAAWFQSQWPASKLCEPLKKNAPFQCNIPRKRTFTEKLSLAYSNSMLLSHALTALLVVLVGYFWPENEEQQVDVQLKDTGTIHEGEI